MMVALVSYVVRSSHVVHPHNHHQDEHHAFTFAQSNTQWEKISTKEIN